MEALNLQTQPEPNALGMQVRTEAQIAASRMNGMLSRGPVSAFGKMRSRKNALKHGLLSAVIRPIDTVVMRASDFDTLLQSLMEDYKPETQTELALVESLAVNFVRLRYAMELDMARHDIPTADKYSMTMSNLKPMDAQQAERELAVLEFALQALSTGQPFSLSGEDVKVLSDCLRHEANSKDHSCRRFLDDLIQKRPQPEGSPPMTPDFRTFGLMMDIFTNEIPRTELTGLESILRDLKAMRKQQLTDARQRTDRINGARNDYFRNHINGFTPNIDSLMRYEGHIRKLIEKDLKLLFSLKQVREREAVVSIPMGMQPG